LEDSQAKSTKEINLAAVEIKKLEDKIAWFREN